MSIKLKPRSTPAGVENLSERVVRCGWCQTDSMGGITLEGMFQGKRRAQCLCIVCGARSPIAEGNTFREAIEAAYAAATSTPPNRPLTREQVEALEPKMTPIWYATINLGLLGMIEAYVAQRDPVYWMHDGMLLFARKPNPADIAAAREAGKGEELCE